MINEEDDTLIILEEFLWKTATGCVLQKVALTVINGAFSDLFEVLSIRIERTLFEVSDFQLIPLTWEVQISGRSIPSTGHNCVLPTGGETPDSSESIELDLDFEDEIAMSDFCIDAMVEVYLLDERSESGPDQVDHDHELDELLDQFA